jgi:hypothetical protein
MVYLVTDSLASVYTSTISVQADINKARKRAETFKNLELIVQQEVWKRHLKPGTGKDCLGWWMAHDSSAMNDQEINRRKMRDLYCSKLDSYR